MLTGRWTIAISCSRSGTSSGAMSGSSSLSGRECTPGTKKPVSLKNSSASVADQRQIEIAGARAVGVERRAVLPAAPVTALPRSTTVVPGGIASSIVRQNVVDSRRSPPKARRMTLSRFCCSVRPPWSSRTSPMPAQRRKNNASLIASSERQYIFASGLNPCEGLGRHARGQIRPRLGIAADVGALNRAARLGRAVCAMPVPDSIR